MSLIWIILINTIIGMVLYPVSIAIAVWYVDKKYGIDVAEESGNDNLNNINDLSTIFGIDNRVGLYLVIALSIIFWEIAIPINFYCNIIKIKDLHEIKGGDNRKITRIKDLKASAVKADIKYAKTIIEISKNRRNRDAEYIKFIMDCLDINDSTQKEIYEMLETLIEVHKDEISDYDLFLQDMKKYH